MAMGKDRNQQAIAECGHPKQRGLRWQAANYPRARKILDPTKRGLAYATSEGTPSPSIARPQSGSLIAPSLQCSGQRPPRSRPGRGYMVHKRLLLSYGSPPSSHRGPLPPSRLVASSAVRALSLAVQITDDEVQGTWILTFFVAV
ncbi:hypothetical protein BO71DRAFT_425807 [Aspergillus ellipticus CBS 707.79]|uniref:Uncharacterized protein n=1 Tax=Aspergillus ellipticus CBS 707.79 TaxID=1448320 RepID=A0A319DMJ6_9EURO|nr:hypothetical protein BO71DRAFT_425807 [Aspergillus ellipticus CBS 707.79]